MALAIFLVPRLLADENNFGRVGSFAEHGLRGVNVQVASAAALHGFPQRARRGMFRNVLGGAGGFCLWHGMFLATLAATRWPT